MSIKIHNNILQGTEEWLKLRLGILTGTKFAGLVTPLGKVSEAKAVDSVRFNLLAERIQQRIEPEYLSYDMERGSVLEEYARKIYSEEVAEVKEAGFITNSTLGFNVGFSPDGLVGSDGMIEMKSRLAKYTLKTLLSGVTPSEFVLQCQVGLFVSGRDWIDYISYTPGIPLAIVRNVPCPKMQGAIKAAAEATELEVTKLLQQYNNKKQSLVQTEWFDYDALLGGM